MDIPVYCGNSFVGFMHEEDCRDIIRSGEGRFVRGKKNDDRRIVLKTEALAKAKALCNSSTRAALSTTQQEELYQGLRRPGHGQLSNAGPVTKVITVVRKYRPGIGFINWGETEKFARKRFNPDKILPPIYQSEAHYKAAHAGS